MPISSLYYATGLGRVFEGVEVGEFSWDVSTGRKGAWDLGFGTQSACDPDVFSNLAGQSPGVVSPTQSPADELAGG